MVLLANAQCRMSEGCIVRIVRAVRICMIRCLCQSHRLKTWLLNKPHRPFNNAYSRPCNSFAGIKELTLLRWHETGLQHAPLRVVAEDDDLLTIAPQSAWIRREGRVREVRPQFCSQGLRQWRSWQGRGRPRILRSGNENVLALLLQMALHLSHNANATCRLSRQDQWAQILHHYICLRLLEEDWNKLAVKLLVGCPISEIRY